MYEEDEQFAQAKSLKRRAVEVARQQAGVDPNWDLQNATSELVRFLHRRAEWQVKREDFPAARDLYQELLTTDGADKAGVRIALARVDRLSILAPEARHRLESAEQADSMQPGLVLSSVSSRRSPWPSGRWRSGVSYSGIRIQL